MGNHYFVLSLCSTMRRAMKELLSKTKKKKHQSASKQSAAHFKSNNSFLNIICADSHEPRDVGPFSSTH